MLLGMTYFQIVSYFLIYSFVGWCIEVIYHAVRFGRACNRGVLNGPVCPVYGFGVILVFGAINLLALCFSSAGGLSGIPIPVLYLAGMILTTFTEFVGGYLLDKFFHARWWDYRAEKFNLGGYICLKFSLIWGAGIVLIVRFLHPILIQNNLSLIPEKYGWWIVLLLYVLYVADLVISALTMIRLNEQLAEIDKLRKSMRVVSNSLSYVLAEGTFVTDDLVRKDKRVYDVATEADAIHTLETKDEFDVKYEALQTSVKEKTEALQSEVNNTLEAAEEKAMAAKDMVTSQMNTARETVTDQMNIAKETVTDQVKAAGDAVSGQMKAATEEWEAWVRKFNEQRHILFRRLFRSHPDITHTLYPEAMDDMRSILDKKDKK